MDQLRNLPALCGASTDLSGGKRDATESSATLEFLGYRSRGHVRPQAAKAYDIEKRLSSQNGTKALDIYF